LVFHRPIQRIIVITHVEIKNTLAGNSTNAQYTTIHNNVLQFKWKNFFQKKKGKKWKFHENGPQNNTDRIKTLKRSSISIVREKIYAKKK
jgi:hypothetical protein